jgi:hypothetical protein
LIGVNPHLTKHYKNFRVFLLQREMNEIIVEDRRRMHDFIIEIRGKFNDVNLKLQELSDVSTVIVHRQVSYIFCDCTVKLTSPYRLACSSTGGKTYHLSVHKDYTSFT